MKSRIKVFHVITDKNIGGAGRWLIYYLQHYDKERFDIKVVIPKGSLLAKYLKEYDTDVIEQGQMPEKSFDVNTIKNLKRLFKKERPSIVHTHASLSARIAARIAGVGYVVNTKHCMENDNVNVFRKIINYLVNKIFSDKIIAVSEATRLSLINAGADKKQIVMIYNGINPLIRLEQDVLIDLKNKYQIKDEEICVGIMARLEHVKDHDVFLKAAKEILTENRKFKFFIVGTGSLEKELKQKVKEYQIENNVIFTGFIENTVEILSLFDINIITSEKEALCLSLIEGMSLGIPAVVTKSGGVCEVVEDGYNGYVVDSKDYVSLAERIIFLSGDKAVYKRFSKNAIDTVNKKFLAVDMVKKIDELYLQS